MSLKPGERVSDVLFRMIVSGVITGRVTSEEGEGIVHAEVIALREPSEEEIEEEDRFVFLPEVSRIPGCCWGADRRSRPISNFRTQARRLLHEGENSYEPDNEYAVR